MTASKVTRIREDAQSGLFDRSIEDNEFEEAIRELKDAEGDEEFQEQLKAYRGVKALVKTKCKFHELTLNERMRVGIYVITGKERNGGGFHVDGWTSIVPDQITEL